MKRVIWFLLLSALSFGLSAQDSAVSISPRWKNSLETVPRKKVTAVFQLYNSTEESLKVITDLVLPDAWKLLIEDSPLRLIAGQAGIKIISFFVPREAEAGNYEIEYLVKEEGTENLLGSFEFSIEVLPHFGIDLQLKKTPSYALAGEEYSAVYLLSNSSNTEVEVDLEVYSSYEFAYEIPDYPDLQVRLDLGETREIVIQVQTTNSYTRVIKHRLTVDALCRLENQQDPDTTFQTSSTAFSDVEVFPQKNQGQVQYHTLPLKITASHVERIGTDWAGDVGLEVSTRGTLDEAGQHNLDVQLRKGLGFPYSTFSNPVDKYSLKYWSDYLELELGDHQYNTNSLLGNTGFGRGAGILGTYRWFGLGGYYYSTPETESLSQYAAGRLEFSIPEGNKSGYPSYTADFHVVSNISESIFFGLHQQVQPFAGLNLELDAVTGSPFTGEYYWAGMFKGRFKHRWLDTTASFKIAQPDYPGDFTDRYTLSVIGNMTFFDKVWKVYTGYSQDQRNLLRDEAMDSAPQTWNIRIGTRYLWKRFDTNLLLGWKLRSYADKLSVPDFDELSNIIEMSLTQPISIFELQGYGSWEILNNQYLSAQAVKHLYTAIVSLLPNRISRYYLNFTTNIVSSEYADDVLQFSLGLGLSYQFHKAKWKLDFTNRYLLTNQVYNGADLNVNTNLTFQFNNIHGMSMAARLKFPRRILESDPDFKLTVKYTASPNLPISRKSNVGSVKGLIYDTGTGEPMQNIILRIEDQVILSNKKGQFYFSAITPGEHFLMIDTSRAGNHLIPNRETPLIIEIGEKKTVRLDIGLIESGTIEGNVTLYTAPKKLQGLLASYSEEDLIEDSGYSRVLIEIEREDESRRLFSDSKGYFIFQDLRPGTWKLKAYQQYLPPDHYFKEDEFILEVSSGEIAGAEIKIFPTKKTFTQIETKGVLTENGHAKEEEKESQSSVEVPESKNVPTLLGLDWNISPDEAGEALKNRNRNFKPLLHISLLPSEWGRAPETDESFELSYSSQVRYFSPGILQQDLLGNVILSFFNPRHSKDQLYLSGVEIQLSDVDDSGAVRNTETVFEELLTLFVSRWNIELDDETLRYVYGDGEYSTIIEGIMIMYKKIPATGRILISYENKAVQKAIVHE